MSKPPDDLGALAVSMGWITQEELEEALRAQKESADRGEGLRVGQVLVERGHLTAAQLRALLTLQGKGIVACPSCKRQYNVASFRIGATATCPGCGATIEVGVAPVASAAVEGTVVLPPEGRLPGDAVPTASVASEEPLPRSFGKYQVIDEIARGGMGIVYRACEMGLGRKVAIKVLIAGEDAGQDQIDRFIREARSAAKLRHPNIVQIHDIGVEHGHHFFTMDLIEGCSLEYLLRHRIGISPTDALRIARDVAYALHYAHQHGIIHRDLKPGNILLEFSGGPRSFPTLKEDGSATPSRFTEGDVGAIRTGLFSLRAEDRVYLTDFGLAKEVGSDTTRLTRTGMTMGTPAYMSPEQARGRIEEVDARSDVFALGTVLYEMVTGRPPFRGDSIIDVMMRVASKDPLGLRQINSSVHPDIETICFKALEKDKSRRYPNALALAADIESYLGGETISARPQTLAYRLRKWIRRNVALVAAVSVTALGISLAFLIPTQVKPWLDRKALEREYDAEVEKRRAAEEKADADARKLLSEARGLEGQGRLPEALAAVTSLLGSARSPRLLPEANFLAAEVQARIDSGQRFDSVAQDPTYRYFAQAYACGGASPWGPRALLAIGARLAEAHDLARSVTVLQRLLQRYPDAPEASDARLALARALAATGRPDEALAVLPAGSSPTLDSLRARLSPFGRVERVSLGADFARAAARGKGEKSEVVLARDGELLVVKWPAEGGPQVAREEAPDGAVLDLVTDGAWTHDLVRLPGGSLVMSMPGGTKALLDASLRWCGGRALYADLEGDGTRELYLPIGGAAPALTRFSRTGPLEEVVHARGASEEARSEDLFAFTPRGGRAEALALATRFAGRAVVQVITAGKDGAPLASSSEPVEGYLGMGALDGRVLAIAARGGKAVVVPLEWDGKSLSPGPCIETGVPADPDGSASVTVLEGDGARIAVRIEGGGAGEDAILLMGDGSGDLSRALEIGVRGGGGAVLQAGPRLVWLEARGTVLASALAGGTTSAPALPRLSSAPPDLEVAQDLLDLGLPNEALAIGDRVAAALRVGGDPSARARPLAEADLIAARAQAARGELDRALAALDEAEAASIEARPRVLRLRADLLLAAGQRAPAEEALRRLLLQEGLSEGEADRVRREIEGLASWRSAKTLLDAQFSTPEAAALRGSLLATDPLRVRREAGGLAIRQSLHRPVAGGVPLSLDGRSFEGEATITLPMPTTGARVEWGLFRRGKEWELVAGARAVGPGNASPDGYRWQALGGGPSGGEELGRWPLSLRPQARLTLCYDDVGRRLDVRVVTAGGGSLGQSRSFDLSNGFPAGEYVFGLAVSPAPLDRQVGTALLGEVAFRAGTLLSFVRVPSDGEWERACGCASLGEPLDAVTRLEAISSHSEENDAARIALLAGGTDGKETSAASYPLPSKAPAFHRALAEMFPALAPESARRVLEYLAGEWLTRTAVERRGAAREALHVGDATTAAAALHSVVREKGVDADTVRAYAQTLFALGQPALAAEQAARIVSKDPDVGEAGEAARREMIHLLWKSSERLPSDPELAGVLSRIRAFPVVRVKGVLPKSAAEAAGIREGDFVVAVEGRPVHLSEEVLSRFESLLCGGHGSVELTVRGGSLETRRSIPVGPLGLQLEDQIVDEGR